MILSIAWDFFASSESTVFLLFRTSTTPGIIFIIEAILCGKHTSRRRSISPRFRSYICVVSKIVKKSFICVRTAVCQVETTALSSRSGPRFVDSIQCKLHFRFHLMLRSDFVILLCQYLQFPAFRCDFPPKKSYSKKYQ